MYLVASERERRIVFVVGNAGDVVVIVCRLHSFDECALVGIKDINMVPLEEDVVHGKYFASDEIPGVVLRNHRRAFDGYEEVGVFEERHDIMLAFVFEDGCVVAGGEACHCLAYSPQTDDSHRCRACADAFGTGFRIGCADATIIGSSRDRRFRRRTSPPPARPAKCHTTYLQEEIVGYGDG